MGTHHRLDELTPARGVRDDRWPPDWLKTVIVIGLVAIWMPFAVVACWRFLNGDPMPPTWFWFVPGTTLAIITGKFWRRSGSRTQ